jgi:DNA polymerase III alpha subunit
VLNKRTVESLIKAGAFDQLGDTRRALFEIHESVVEGAIRSKKAEEHGDVGFDFDSLLDAGEPSTQRVPERPEWPRKELLGLEREMLGLYVSDHPLAGLEIPLALEADLSIAELLSSDKDDGEVLTISGLITAVNHRVARSNGNPYAQVTIEDFYATRLFDVATCLGSLNFGDDAVVGRQINKMVSHLKTKSRVYWRLNPGRRDHASEKCQGIPFYPWSHRRLQDFAELHDFRQVKEQTETHGRVVRLYAEWHRS